MVTITTSASTTGTQLEKKTTLDSTIGSFSPKITEQAIPSQEIVSDASQVFEEQVSLIENKLASSVPLIETLIKTLDEALSGKNTSKTEISYHKSFLARQRESLEKCAFSLKNVEPIQEGERIRVKKIKDELDRIITTITLSESKLPVNTMDILKYHCGFVVKTLNVLFSCD